MADHAYPLSLTTTQKQSSTKDASLYLLKRGNDPIDDIMDRSSWQNPLPTQTETSLITGVDITIDGMAIAMLAVFARGPPVPTGRSMLASSREFVQDGFPLCGDNVVTLPIGHGHAVRKHDGAALRVEFILGPSCLVGIILALKLEPELALQAPLRNESAELDKERLKTTHVGYLVVAILVGLEGRIVINEIMDASELVAVWRQNRLHDLNDPMSRNWNLVKNHDFAFGGVKVLVDQSDTDTLGDVMLVQQFPDVLKILGVIGGCSSNLAN